MSWTIYAGIWPLTEALTKTPWFEGNQYTPSKYHDRASEAAIVRLLILGVSLCSR
jgi:hypothetical protein